MLSSVRVWSQTAGEIDWAGLTVVPVEELFGVRDGVRIYRKRNQGRPPFLEALNKGESDPIEYLFQYTEHPQIVRRILSRGIDPNERISRSGGAAQQAGSQSSPIEITVMKRVSRLQLPGLVIIR